MFHWKVQLQDAETGEAFERPFASLWDPGKPGIPALVALAAAATEACARKHRVLGITATLA